MAVIYHDDGTKTYRNLAIYGNWCEGTTAMTVTSDSTSTCWNNWIIHDGDTGITYQTDGMTAIGDDNIWYEWMGTTDATSTTTWRGWIYQGVGANEPVAREMTEEEQAIHAQELKEARQRDEELRLKRNAELAERKERERIAAERAEELLLSILDAPAQQTFKKHRYIEAWSQSGRRYKIKMGRQHNIFELDHRGKEIKEFCVHVGEQVPNADNVLAQKLMIEHHEELFHRTANVRQLEAA